MGTFNGREEAFQIQAIPRGLDLHLSVINNDLGTYIASPAATIRAGAMVANGAAAGEIVQANATDVLGVSKHAKETFGYSVNVDEAIVLNGTTAANLDRANVSEVTVKSAPGYGGTTYTGGGTDYSVNATNGTITRVALGAITDGQTVYVTYRYALTAADYQRDGTVFHSEFGSNDSVSSAADRLTVIQGWAKLFTVEYDTADDYALTGTDSNLYCDGNGRFSSAATSNDFVGKCIQLPRSGYQYMGLIFNSIAVAA